MIAHPQDDALDLYALGTLEGGERRELEVHLSSCPECRQRLESAHARVHLVALASPWREPPPGAKEKLLARVRAAREVSPRTEAGRIPDVPRRRQRWQWVSRPLAAAWALAAIILAVTSISLLQENRRLQQQLAALNAALREQQSAADHARKVLEVLTAPDTQRVTLVSAEQRPLPHGRVFYNSHMGLVFYAANLPSPPSRRTYQLWLVPMEGKPMSAGVFMPDAHGDAEVMMPPLPPGMPAKAFAVTVEPTGGMPEPTGPKVLIGTAP